MMSLRERSHRASVQLRLAVTPLSMLAAIALAPEAARSRTAEEALADGDQHYAGARLEDACRAYAEAVSYAPNNVIALCRAKDGICWDICHAAWIIKK